MFCCLFLLNNKTGITGFEKESCFSECKYINKDTKKCGILDICEKPLTDNKYGWMIHYRIRFPDTFPGLLGTIRTSLLIVHPSESDMWILKICKNEKMVYKAYIDKKQIDFQNLTALNAYLTNRGYDGRKLIDSDFV